MHAVDPHRRSWISGYVEYQCNWVHIDESPLGRQPGLCEHFLSHPPPPWTRSKWLTTQRLHFVDYHLAPRAFTVQYQERAMHFQQCKEHLALGGLIFLVSINNCSTTSWGWLSTGPCPVVFFATTTNNDDDFVDTSVPRDTNSIFDFILSPLKNSSNWNTI